MRKEDYESDFDWLFGDTGLTISESSSHQEELVSKLPLKVGDIVRIKSRDWYNRNKNCCGDVDVPCTFVSSMAEYCGQTFRIIDISRGGSVYKLDEPEQWDFSIEMFDLD